MLKEILSISGKSGLYRLLTQGRNSLIVETIGPEKRRMPIYGTDKVISLGDIAMYTETGEEPLYKVLESVKQKENGAVAAISPKADKEALRAYFAEVLPDFDRERVYPTDISKLISWYNLLIQSGITDFIPEESAADGEEKSAE